MSRIFPKQGQARMAGRITADNQPMRGTMERVQGHGKSRTVTSRSSTGALTIRRSMFRTVTIGSDA
jgi:hypothetical protein